MSSLLIPADWKVKRSTPFFTKENVPAALLSHHNTGWRKKPTVKTGCSTRRKRDGA